MAEPFVQMETENGPTLLVIESWSKQFHSCGLSAGFTTRQGGVSEGHTESLNCALHVEDRPQDVVTNRGLVADALGFSRESWTCAEQVHGAAVYEVMRQDIGKGLLNREHAIQGVDALITRERNVLLTAFFADCVPIWLWDPVQQAIGLAHAGWKGTALEIGAEAVHELERRYGSKPADIRAAIGPSIGACCYEVDHRVIRAMEALRLSFEENRPGWTISDTPDRFMLNLQEINRQILIKAGILPIHIEITTLCTGCDCELFFSHRMEQGRTGRMAAWIGLTNEE